ncbi:hypothetical protein CIPAW_15G172600 [Carya illinoinensis]|uniref:DUF4219 domain-containing protein n=1 Tax=Carya illinoinensis TaxID=32201 RepID=A0A8T1NGG3_CARIL|nr:hypothetical protein CIPAW_15G172600 [Carya illinoinensis]
MATGNTQTTIPKLFKDNYDHWCIQMRALLGAQDAMDMVEDGYEESTSKQTEATMTDTRRKIIQSDRKKDCKAKSILYQGPDEATFEIIAPLKTSKEVWETLHKTYRGVDKVEGIRL